MSTGPCTSILDVDGIPQLVGKVIATRGHVDALQKLYDHINSWADSRVNQRFRVSIQEMVESHRTTYWVVLERGDRPLDLPPWEKEGRTTPFMHENREYSVHEAKKWSQFLGVDAPEPCNCIMCKAGIV